MGRPQSELDERRGPAHRAVDLPPRDRGDVATWRECGGLRAAPTDADASTRGLRVLSCNLLGGRAHPDALRDLLARYEVDVVCVQELDERLAATLAAALPEGRLVPCPRRRGLGVVGRRPLSVQTLELGGRDGLVAKLSPADWPALRGPLELVNVHILAPHTWPYFPRRDRRPRQMNRLLAYLDAHPTPARAVVGDFNATPWWPAYRAIAARYSDAVAALPGRAPRTWPNLSRLGWPGLLRIDHCFVSGVRAARATRIPIRGSDHYAICVDLVASDAPHRVDCSATSGGACGCRPLRGAAETKS